MVAIHKNIKVGFVVLAVSIAVIICLIAVIHSQKNKSSANALSASSAAAVESMVLLSMRHDSGSKSRKSGSKSSKGGSKSSNSSSKSSDDVMPTRPTSTGLTTTRPTSTGLTTTKTTLMGVMTTRSTSPGLTPIEATVFLTSEAKGFTTTVFATSAATGFTTSESAASEMSEELTLEISKAIDYPDSSSAQWCRSMTAVIGFDLLIVALAAWNKIRMWVGGVQR